METKTMGSDMKFCQSCGMPLNKPEEYATEKDGSANADYCVYCYKEGAFTSNGSMEEMIDTCVPFMVQGGMEEGAARKMMAETLPQLKRWAK